MENTLPRKATAGLRTFLSTGKQRAVLIKSVIHVKTAQPARSGLTPSPNHLQGGKWTSLRQHGLLASPVLIHIALTRSLCMPMGRRPRETHPCKVQLSPSQPEPEQNELQLQTAVKTRCANRGDLFTKLSPPLIRISASHTKSRRLH